uniref:Scaffolding anchor of CK1 domain-containing protein n=1 Tax=Mola mola TaxID=94237 RepID=A0A3Q3W444_MOLML
MARRSQCSSAGDNPLDPNYLPPHYREEYRLAIDALIEEDLDGYNHFLEKANVVDFLSLPEIQYIRESVQLPQQSIPEQRFLEPGGDGSSDTYWPIHSDLDAPGLDLGWPQLHHFIGPTEVTTLVNPPEPDMPSIKEQARRLIKNAQQVIAIVMDMFTDVDILHDILNAAMRNVAVYILLDEQNVHHFINMLSNCRVNLQSMQFIRVRTVSGITYHCRSGKSFKGQVMDLSVCINVMTCIYQEVFMWSFEKIHRCMAHLFLGQLVATFDEEFRILYAHSQPLIIENTFTPMEDISFLQKRQYPSERVPLYRDPRKFLNSETALPEDLARPSYDERMDMDWRTMLPKRKDSLHSPADIYSRYTSQHSRMDPSFEQGPSRIPVMENPAFKRHSYAEGVHGRYQFLSQQGMPDAENHGRQFNRQQQLYPGPAKETDYGAYEKFWNQDYHVSDQYSEPGVPQEMEPQDNFDPVLNYLSSTRNIDFDQGSDKLTPAADLPSSSSYPRRMHSGQPYACQKSPTPPNPTEQKQFFMEPNPDRKDPMVKRGLRDWRISSYLSAYDEKGDESLPFAPTDKLPDEPASVVEDTKTTRTPSESSLTTEGEKTVEAEQKEPKTSVFHREDPFRRKYNAAVPRSSRLRSSLIFSSLDQQHTSQDAKTTLGQHNEESDKNEAEQTKQPFLSQVLGKRRSQREPFEWSRYIKSTTFDNSATDSSKADDGTSKADDKDSSKDENSKDLSRIHGVQESLKPTDVASCTADVGKTVSTDPCKSVSQSFEASDKTNKEFSRVKIDPSTTKTSTESKTTTSADSEIMELKSSQPAATLLLSAEPEEPQSKPLEKPKLSNPTVEKSGKSCPPIQKSTTPPDVPASSEGTDECEDPGLAPTQNEPSSLTPSSVEILPSSGLASLDSNTQSPESITSSEVVPLSPQSKQSKSSQPRYHSSTANVLSSSNLRDDTKLLLEQISANSQSRNEMSKESPVTDDEKEGEADKNAKREKDRQIRSFIKGQPKSNQDREKLLERIQSMRKERKVYSRFEGFSIVEKA